MRVAGWFAIGSSAGGYTNAQQLNGGYLAGQGADITATNASFLDSW
jgi:hypothetical protein